MVRVDDTVKTLVPKYDAFSGLSLPEESVLVVRYVYVSTISGRGWFLASYRDVLGYHSWSFRNNEEGLTWEKIESDPGDDMFIHVKELRRSFMEAHA